MMLRHAQRSRRFDFGKSVPFYAIEQAAGNFLRFDAPHPDIAAEERTLTKFGVSVLGKVNHAHAIGSHIAAEIAAGHDLGA
jgi:hypothetical protein